MLLGGGLALLNGCGAPLAAPDDSGGDANGIMASALFPDDADPATAALPYVEEEILVRPYPGAEDAELRGLYRGVGALLIAEEPEIVLHVLRVDPAERTSAATALAQSDLVESVHKNYILHAQRTPNDPLYIQQPHLPQIAAPAAWDVTTSDPSIMIAIVDTGVQPDHPDLAAQILDGWNVYDNNPRYDDVLGHGTQAAGCAAAMSDNGTGVAGVAWNSRLLAVRVTDVSGLTTSRHLAAGILWAAARGARVINVSFAPLWSNVVVQSAAASAFHRGSLVVISAGNAGGMAAAAGYPEAIFVGAVSSTSAIAAFSDRGPFVDLVAPGTAIQTTAPGGGYNLANGTSFAAPLVSGAAALAWSVHPELPPYLIRDALYASATDLGAPGRESTFGHGMVHAQAAVERVRAVADLIDTVPPAVTITAPRNNAVVSGRIRVSTAASDANGVAQVVLFLDDRPIATDTLAPFEFSWDSALTSPGAHRLTVVATDAAGNDSVPRAITVTTSGVLTALDGVQFRAPADGSTVIGNVTIQATVSASAGLTAVEWLVDGQSALVSTLTGTSSGVTYLWRTGGLPRGPHAITLIAIDGRGIERSAVLTLNLR